MEIFIAFLALFAAPIFIFMAIHRVRETLICCFGIFVLLQDLIVRNVGGYESVVGGAIKKIDEVVILAIFLLIVLGRLSKGQPFVRTSISLPLWGIVIVGVLSSLIASVPFFIFTSQLFLLIKGFLIFYIFANLHFSEEDIKIFVKVFKIVALIFLMLGFVDIVAPERFRAFVGTESYIDWRAGIPAVQSLFVHPGVFGWFMAFASLYAFSFAFIFKRPRDLLLIFLFPVGVFIAMRRKALGGIIVGLLGGIRALSRSQKIHFIIPLALFAVILLLVAWPKFVFLYDTMMDVYFKHHNPLQVPRVALYGKSVEIAMDYFPLGAGLGRYGSWMSRVHYSPLYEQYGLSTVYGLSSENPLFINDTFWPMILGETGFIGLFFYFWAMITLLKACYKGTKFADTPFSKAFCLGTLMVLIEALVESIATHLFVKPPQAYFVFGVVGMTYSLLRNHRVEKEIR